MSESNDPNDKENVKVASWLATDKTIKPVTATDILAEKANTKFDVTVPVATITFWQTFIHEWAERKGWNQGLEEHSFGDWMALLHSEISEAYEDYRDDWGPAIVYYENTVSHQKHTQMEYLSFDEQYKRFLKPCGIPIELADLAIRLFHLCAFFKIDLNQMIALKMAYNETRPYRHGGKKV